MPEIDSTGKNDSIFSYKLYFEVEFLCFLIVLLFYFYVDSRSLLIDVDFDYFHLFRMFC